MAPSYTTKVTPDWEKDRRGRNPELTGQKLDAYTHIRQHPHCTRASVAKALGIKSSTITARIKELIDAGLVLESGTVKGAARVQNRTLFASPEYEHKQPKDRVRVRVKLLVDIDGNYFAEAEVVGQHLRPRKARKQAPRPVLAHEITISAPYPNEYRHLFLEDDFAEVSPQDTMKNSSLIVDS